MGSSILAVAGCLGTTGAGRTLRTVTVHSEDDIPDSTALSLDAEVDHPDVTARHRAIVAVTLTNHGDDARHLVPAFPDVPSYLFGTPGLVLVLLDDAERSSPACFDGGSGSLPSSEGGHRPVSFAPGERAVTRFELADDPRYDGCFSPGRYRFERTLELGEEPGKSPVHWGFELNVEKPA